MSNTTKHILVIRLSAMGDVAMTVPVLNAFSKQYPEIKITVLTRPFFTPFFRGLQNVSVFSIDVKGKHKGVFGLYKLARELNENNQFFAVADLHNVLRSKILKQFIKCKRFVSIDKGRKEKRLLTSGKIFEPLKTTHQRYADVFGTLGFPIDLSTPQFPNKAILNETIKKLIGNHSKKLVGIAPFAAHEGKMYPLDAMKVVIEKLSKDHKVILFGGGKNEIEVLNNFENSFKDTVNVAGKLSLDEELDLISNLDVMLSMDSGNAHVAAMLGVKVVTIWGVTHPFAGFTPFNQPDAYCLLPNRKEFPLIPTSVYGNKYPENYKKAAGSIEPEIVVEKIKSII
ncbi:glycosyltransferase family 9 protein [Flaviramulus sp. BrNp1-15]|uniref:glycosyltransferase family 9 protein n=1 Tax=Flaviramulus sp. BrNp1-15 TaxID=2916754 RepID=UPI001EE8BAB0|nr:glycosyltransferase family 9 protein [Flaviramulus sp. BrNp1-15]ULC59767.1 glycosyltransferase family 9 protein [Flaviramulus sp. BrNp1-15]